MSRTIDERIVQMTFKNEEFESRAKTTMSTLGKLKEALTDRITSADFGGIGRTVDSIGTNFAGLYSSVETVKNGFSALETLAVGALLNIGRKAEDAGAKLIKSLTVDNITGGWTKYNDLTSSVQTLVNSTGKSVDEIDGYLERLMWYSDETSFGFTDMTKALGTMVSSGGDIDKLIPMLMGVGNATAYAGKTSAEFQRVIYNLNQSYSSGYLNTMDWRSIELAGVDSKELKEQLLGTAVALGKIDKSKATLSNFKDLLSDKVFTRDVMEQAFTNFAQMTLEAEKLVNEGKFKTTAEAIESLSGKYEEFAERAFKSAQEAKSFGEAVEATKDAVSSGWMQTFKLIFGNYEEAKALWTDVTESFWDWFASGAKQRNDTFSEWKKLWTDQIELQKAIGDGMRLIGDTSRFVDLDDSLTQTQALWRSFSYTITKVRDDISDVWESVFPTDIEGTARKIFNIVEKIRGGLLDFSESADKNAVYQSLLKIVEALVKSFKTLIDLGKTFYNSFIKPLAEKLKPILTEIMEIFGALGDRVSASADGISNNMAPLVKVFNAILNILDPVISLIGKVVSKIHELVAIDEETEKVSVFAKAFESVGDILETIAKVFNGTINIFKELGGALGTLFDKIKGVVGEFLESNGTNVAKFAEGGVLGVLAVGLTKVIGKLDKLDIKTVLEGIMSFITGKAKDVKKGPIETIKEFFDTVTKGINEFTESVKIKLLESIGNSLIKLATAMLILSLVDSDKILDSLMGLAGALGEILLAMKVSESFDTKNFLTSAKGISKIATALLVLSIALKILSTIDAEDMKKVLVSTFVLLAELGTFMVLVSNLTKTVDPKSIKAIGKAMSSIGFALIEIAIALKIMSTIDAESMTVALQAFGQTLLGMGLFIVAVGNLTTMVKPTSLAAIGLAMMGISAGLLILSAALWAVSKIDAKGLDTGVLAIFESLLMIAGFTAVVAAIGAGKFIAVAAGMLVMSAALGVLAAVIIGLGKAGMDTVGPGLKAMAIGLAAIGVLGSVLGLAAPFFLLFAAALGVFGLALISLSEGILAFSAAYAVFQVMGNDFASALLDIFEQATAAIVGFIPMFIAGIVDAVLQTAGKLVELLNTLLDILITAASESLPKLLEFLIQAVLAVLNAINDHVQEFVQVILSIIANIIIGIGQGISDIIDALVELVVDIINGLADAIRNNAGGIGEAIGNLVSALITGAVDGIGSAVVSFGSGLVEGGKDIWNNIVSFFTGDEAETGNKEAGSTTVEGVKLGIEEKGPELISTVKEIADDTVAEFDRNSEANENGDYTIEGFIKAATDNANLTAVYNAYYNVGQMGIKGLKDGSEVKSPSKAARKIGNYIAEGLILGVTNRTSDILDAGYTAGSAVLGSISKAVDLANSILEDNLDPVITPVLDLSNVQENAGMISDLLAARSSFDSALAINSNSPYGNIQNGATSNSIVMENTFKFGSIDEFDRGKARGIAEMLLNEMNTLLGEQI